MSAVRKQEIQEDILPFSKEDPECPFVPESEMMAPPIWGKFTHSEADLRSMWGRIWRCFKSKELCKSFMFYNRIHSLEVWCAAFETVRQKKEGEFDRVIRYAKRIGDTYEIKGTPAEVAEKEAKEQERLLKLKQQGAVLAALSPEDPDVQAFKRRNKDAPLEEMASHPMTLRYKNRIRGDQ